MSKIKGTREKHFPYGKVYQKRDFGNERVATLDELLMKDPVPPGDAMPASCQHILEHDSAVWYTESDREPEVQLVKEGIGHGPNSTIWKVSLDYKRNALWNGRPGLNQTIINVDELVNAANLPRHETSYRPPWVRTEFLPRLSPRSQFCEADVRSVTRVAPIIQPKDYVGEGYVSGWPWTCIGKVTGGFDTDFDRPITSGTGVLVGRNILLTASHLAIWNRGPGKWWMRFFPGWDINANPSLGNSFVEQFRGPGPQSHPNSKDFVVCKLYNPLGDALGFFGCHWSSDDDFYYDQRWLSAGYPSFKFGGQRLISMYDIEVQDIDNDGDGREIEISLNNFLLNGGWSGGPLWGWFPGNDPRVIGICSGYDSDGWDPVRSVFAGGGPLLNFIRAARHDWS